MKAFPKSNSVDKDGRLIEDHEDGMDLRVYLAAKAMQALLSNPSIDFVEIEDVASDSFRVADAMLKEGAK